MLEAMKVSGEGSISLSDDGRGRRTVQKVWREDGEVVERLRRVNCGSREERRVDGRESWVGMKGHGKGPE